MIVQPGPQAPPHFFLIGYRAPPGQLGTDFEEVGAVVVRQVLDLVGAAADAGDVLKEDAAFDQQPAEGPFRYESEIAAWKPEPDVVVVDELVNFLTAVQIADPNLVDLLAAEPYGAVEVDRGAGFGLAVARDYGWLPRGSNPRLTRRRICSNICSGKAMLFVVGYPHRRCHPASMSAGASSVRDDQ